MCNDIWSPFVLMVTYINRIYCKCLDHFCLSQIELMPTKKQRGGSCGAMCPMQGGYYRPTARNRYFLKRYKQGKSIGFTMRASLKAKGMIPRANGTKRHSIKYRD